MNSLNERTKEETIRKNQPTKVLPIMNTIFAAIMLAGSIYCKIAFSEQFTTGYFILFMVLVILYPVASWYNSYFSKINNLKKIKNYDHETKEIVSYIKRLNNYSGIELNSNNKIKVKYELTNDIINKNPEYDIEHCSFGLAKDDAIIITFGVTFAGLELKGYSKEIVGLCGVMPRSIWYKRHLKVPFAKKGKIKFEAVGFNFKEKQVIQALKTQETYYDNKTGWLLTGEKKSTILDEVIEIMNDVYVVIRNEEIISIWIKLEPNLAI